MTTRGCLGGIGEAETAELTGEDLVGRTNDGFGRLSARRGPGALFTLRESRRGHLET